MSRLALLLVLAVFPVQDSAETYRVFAELGQQKIDVSEKAHARLLQIGVPALALLRKDLEKSAGEAQVRRRSIIEDIERLEAERVRDTEAKRKTVEKCRAEDKEFEDDWEKRWPGGQIRSETAWFSLGGRVFKEHHTLHTTTRSNLRQI